jgi:hypothetical protein
MTLMSFWLRARRRSWRTFGVRVLYVSQKEESC